MWNKNFVKTKLYTFYEAFSLLGKGRTGFSGYAGGLGLFDSDDDFYDWLTDDDFMNYQDSFLSSIYLPFVITSSSPYTSKTDAKVLFNSLIQRYAEHYFIETDETDVDELSKIARKHFRKVIEVLSYTYEKYSSLLTFYANKKANLLEGIKLIESETSESSQHAENSSSGSEQHISKSNDTPQLPNTSDVFADDGYVSNLEKGNSEDSASSESDISGDSEIHRTHTNDRDTLIERLNEIEKKYSNVFMKWLNEFDFLFIAEENY